MHSFKAQNGDATMFIKQIPFMSVHICGDLCKRFKTVLCMANIYAPEVTLLFKGDA